MRLISCLLPVHQIVHLLYFTAHIAFALSSSGVIYVQQMVAFFVSQSEQWLGVVLRLTVQEKIHLRVCARWIVLQGEPRSLVQSCLDFKRCVVLSMRSDLILDSCCESIAT